MDRYLEQLLGRQQKLIAEYIALRNGYFAFTGSAASLYAFACKDQALVRQITAVDKAVNGLLQYGPSFSLPYRKLMDTLRNCRNENEAILRSAKQKKDNIKKELGLLSVRRVKYNLPRKSPFIRNDHPRYIDITG